jgi:hypothetical protein
MRLFYNALLAAASLTLVVACSENQLDSTAPQPENSSSARLAEASEGRCATMKVLSEKLAENPGLARSMDAIEAHAQRFAEQQKGASGSKPGSGGDGGGGTTPPPTVGGIITIPVYVHVIYDVTKPVQNIIDAQIQSQIDVMNQDFRAANADKSKTPSEFAGSISDFEIQFSWNTGNLARIASTRTSWGTRDAMKYSSNGGSDAKPGFLNIWVCNIGGGILGYAQFPGGAAATDGIVVGPEYFGSSALKGTNPFFLAAPYDLGRTATHEIGHWLNLRHIWGDGACGVDDFVSDTPLSSSANYGCPGVVTKCKTRDMTMNYMDYTYDGCMYMFTHGQKTRSRALFATGGARSSFVRIQ